MRTVTYMLATGFSRRYRAAEFLDKEWMRHARREVMKREMFLLGVKE